MKKLIKKYDWGGSLPQVNDPNQWSSGASLSSFTTIPALTSIDLERQDTSPFKPSFMNNLMDENTGVGKIFSALGGAPGLTQTFSGLSQLVQPGSGTGAGSAVGSILGNVIGKGGSKLFGISPNPMSGLVGSASTFGVNMLGKVFGKDTNYSDVGSNILNGVADGLNMLGPWGMAASGLIKLTNMLGSQTVKGVKHNEQSQKTLGSSYNLSQYDMADKTFGIAGIGKAKKYKKQVNHNREILGRADDVSYDTYQDNLRKEGSLDGIISRNKMEESGGIKTFSVKKGGVLLDVDFAKRCLSRRNGGNLIHMPEENMSLIQFMKYISDTGRMSDDYDYESFFNDKDLFKKWLKYELSNPMKAHFSDKYKKPNHITFSEESIYSNEKTKGGRWLNEDGKMYFIPTDLNIKNAGGEDKLREYFKINEPNVTLSFPDNDTLYMKKGGTFNVIPSGNLHKERHNLENKTNIFNDYTMVTSKGIPVIEIKDGGVVKQHAEIERDELIFRKEATDNLIELMNSDEEDSDFKAGELILDELFNKTHDNSGLIRKIKIDSK